MNREELTRKYCEFDSYMTYSRCDQMHGEDGCGIYKGDVMSSVGAFVEFCLEGKVTDDDGRELEE